MGRPHSIGSGKARRVVDAERTMSGDYPRTEEEIAADFAQRRAGLLKALTDGTHCKLIPDQ